MCFKLTESIHTAVWLFAILATTPLSARPYDLQFNHISVEHGLSNFSITDIIQDGQGYMWFATEDGLNKYDGYNFTVYRPDPSDSNSVAGAYISNLYTDRQGTLWIVAGGKLCLYDATTDKFKLFTKLYQDTDILNNAKINKIFEDRNAGLWIGTDAGLYYFDRRSDRMIHYGANDVGLNPIEGNNITAFCEDRQGNLWIGTSDAGISRYDRTKKTFIQYVHSPEDPDGLSSNSILCITEDRSGVIWIGSVSGINRYNPDTGKILRLGSNAYNSYNMPPDIIFDIYEDRKGSIWVGTFHIGLWRYERETGQFFHFESDPMTSYSLSQNRIQCIFEDRSGVLWFGTYRGGINYYERQQETFIRYRMNESVYAVLNDRHSDLWIGTAGNGLLRFNRNGKLIRQYVHDPRNPESLGNNSVMAIFEDSGGDLWIGTGDGLDYYDIQNNRFIHYRHDYINPAIDEHHEVKVIFEDYDREVWIGTKGSGLCRLDRKTKAFTYYRNESNNQQSLSNNNIWAISSDNNGDLWIGTFGRGLNHLNRKTNTFTRYEYDPDNTNGINNNAIYSIYIDSTGNIWAGTFGGGLNRYDPLQNKFIHYTVQDGLADNFVKGILPDRHGNLWISTDKGLSKVKPDSNGSSITVKNYTVEDGLINNVFLSGAYCKSPDGQLFFGGEGGCIAFHPDRIKENQYIPPVLIISFRVFDKNLPLAKSVPFISHIDLSYQQNFFSFEFAALDYNNPMKNKYAYKLDGFDPDWVQSGKRRYASYTNVDAGEYVFRVKGSNHDGIWNENGSAVSISISPPFWQTWLFRLLVLIIIVSVTFGIYRYRIRQLLAIEQLRTRLAADLHDEIASNLSSIVMFGQIIQNETPDQGNKQPVGLNLLQRIINLSQESITSIREIIWAIDPKLETIYDLLMRVSDMAMNACRGKGIRFRFDAPARDQLPSDNLSPEQRKHLWLLLKEAINNAIKHSGCTELSVQSHYKSGKIIISINDNGTGFDIPDRPAQFTGKGLETMKNRAEQLRGSFSIDSDRDKGTSVEIITKI